MLTACDEPPQSEMNQRGPQGPAEVGVMELQPQDVPIISRMPGRTAAALVAEVRPQVSGIITERLFTEGAQVEKGQALYKIDPAPYQAALDAARAQLQRAEATVPSARSQLARYRRLVQRNAVSEQELETAEADYQQAVADVAVAEADVESARINLDYTTIRAPISGKIGASSETVGALVTADQDNALTVIRTLHPIKVNIQQPSTSLLRLRRAVEAGRIQASDGAVPVRLRLEDGSLYDQPGTLQFAEATINESTGTVTLRAEFPNPERLLIPGMYVTGIVQEGIARDRFLVPQLAVFHNAQGQAAARFATADDKLEVRILKVEQVVDHNWLVDEGVQAGDRLILQGAANLSEGHELIPYAAEIVAETGTVKRASTSSGTNDKSGGNSGGTAAGAGGGASGRTSGARASDAADQPRSSSSQSE